MSAQPEALRLADLLEPCCLTIGDAQQAVAAAELRRQHEECNDLAHQLNQSNERNGQLIAQRDALLEALKEISAMWDHHCYAHGDGQPTPLHIKARAAIAKAEGENT